MLLLITIFIYLPPTFVKFNNLAVQKEIDGINILKANLNNWVGQGVENNVHLIIFLTLILTAITFLISGLIKNIKNKRAK